MGGDRTASGIGARGYLYDAVTMSMSLKCLPVLPIVYFG